MRLEGLQLLQLEINELIIFLPGMRGNFQQVQWEPKWEYKTGSNLHLQKNVINLHQPTTQLIYYYFSVLVLLF